MTMSVTELLILMNRTHMMQQQRQHEQAMSHTWVQHQHLQMGHLMGHHLQTVLMLCHAPVQKLLMVLVLQAGSQM